MLGQRVRECLRGMNWLVTHLERRNFLRDLESLRNLPENLTSLTPYHLSLETVRFQICTGVWEDNHTIKLGGWKRTGSNTIAIISRVFELIPNSKELPGIASFDNTNARKSSREITAGLR
jgi:hypothetical protein